MSCCDNQGTTTMPKDAEAVRNTVRESYAKVARDGGGCGCGQPTAHAEAIGYSTEEISEAGDGANLGLGCGNPTALAELREGEVVVDLGAGAGFDALIAARKVGPTGQVIGVDMTDEMLERARQNAAKVGVSEFVEFRKGVIESLPVEDETVDVVISNCVINLSPDKPQSFREAFRVLKPGGRLAVSDIVLSAPLDPAIAKLAAAYVGCVSGASVEEDYLAAIRAAGFVDVTWERVPAGPALTAGVTDPMLQQAIALLGRERIEEIAGTVWSYKIRAEKPDAALAPGQRRKRTPESALGA